MPITSVHADYASYSPQWKACRDLAAGEYAIKDAGETYLPKMSGISDAEYLAYKARACLFGAFGRTVDGLMGMVARKVPEREISGGLTSLLDSVDNAGTALDEFALNAVRDIITVGRGGFLVEYPTIPDGTTVGEVERNKLRPHASYYHAESIVDWRTQRVGNAEILTMVKLRETIARPSANDPWVVEAVTQYRVLELAGGVYSQSLFVQSGKTSEKSSEYVLKWSIVPQLGGVPFREIPFVFVGTVQVSKPPLIDLATLNIAHYRNSADYENGLHWTGVPTPVFIGSFADMGPDGGEVHDVTLGATAGIHLLEGGSAHFLEFNGTGLEGNLGKAMDRKADMMATLGARMLETEKKTAESYDTVSIRRQGEMSVLAAIANNVSRAIQKMLSWMDVFYGNTGRYVYWLNTDYLPKAIDGNMVREVVAAWQAGAFSTEEMFEVFRAGEMVRSDKTVEDHDAEVMNDSVRVGIMAKAQALLAPKKVDTGQAAQV